MSGKTQWGWEGRIQHAGMGQLSSVRFTSQGCLSVSDHTGGHGLYLAGENCSTGRA